jgi:hypothetical protein
MPSPDEPFQGKSQSLEQGTGSSSNEVVSPVQAGSGAEASVQSDGPTTSAVTVAWQDMGASKVGTQFVVQLTNTSPAIHSVELHLSSFTPSNEVIEQKFMEVVLDPRESRAVPINIDDVPVQSTVHPSALRVRALYKEQGATTELPFTAFTDPLMITFDGQFKVATARSVGEQIRVNSNVSDLTNHLLEQGEVLVRNPQNATFSRAEADNSDARQGPTLIVSQPQSPPDFKTATHFPETAGSQGDER